MPRNRKTDNRGESSSRDTLRWTPEMDALLLDALLEEVHKGNRPDGTFTTAAYATIVAELKESIGPFFQKHHIKNRLRTLKEHFNECYDLFHKWSGVAWNPTTRMFDAEPEVWNEICADKPEAQKWKRTPIHNYDKLLELFARDRATGTNAETLRDKVHRWQSAQFDLNDSFEFMSGPDLQWGSEAPNSTQHVDAFSSEGPPSHHSQEYAPSNPSTHSQGTSSSKGSKRKAPMVDVIEKGYERLDIGMEKLTDVMREVADKHTQAIRESVAIFQSSRPRYYSEAEVWGELENIGVPQDNMLMCYNFLCDNEKARNKFFGVPPHFRLQLLYQLMANAGDD